MIDSRDLRILIELAKDARTPLTHIARILNISDVAVKKRLERLEREGVIKGYVINVNPRLLGFTRIALIGVNVEPGKILDVARKIADMKESVFVALTSGDHDVMVEVWCKDSEELANIIDRIRRLPGVKDIFPAIILELIKEREPFPIRKLVEDIFKER